MPFLICVLLFVGAFQPQPAQAHDPSAWGGAFRTRDLGQSWLPADAGLFIGGALDLAVDPADPNHLLYATDTRLLRSRNGGRDWKPEAPDIFLGATLAVAFLADGKGALASTSQGLFRTSNGSAWVPVSLSQAALPVRRIVVGGAGGPVFAIGRRGVYVSHDAGTRFERSGAEVLPDAAASALLVLPQAANLSVVVSQGQVWASADAGANWQVRHAGLPKGSVELVGADASDTHRLWAAAGNQLYLSTDLGKTWRAFGQPLPESGSTVRGIVADAAGQLLILATSRGALRSRNGGTGWELIEGTLPVHQEAGPLVRDPKDASTLYIGFSLMPYSEVWRRAEQGSNLLAQIDPYSLAGGAAFLVLLGAGAALLVRRLAPARAGAATARSSP